MAHVIAIDLGADSGRVMRVWLEDGKLQSEEVHRFPNTPVTVDGHIYWDILRLWHEVTTGIAKAADGAASLGINVWGVDFALLDRDDRLLSNPLHYRDSRTNGAMEWVFERIPRREVFERTGGQFMQLNTLYQLASMKRDNSPLLEIATTYLGLPDLFHYWLTGQKAAEFTHATTTQFYNTRTNDWDRDILQAIGIRPEIFPKVVPPGTRLGEHKGIPVILPACHDTGSAIAGTPLSSADAAYLSSGTWSLIGLELTDPVINDASYEANVTNEGGVYGTYRFLKNVMGLWLAQQCRATWRARGADYSYDQLTELAEQAEPFQSFVDPDDPVFLPPGDMPERIREYCAHTNQPVPETEGQVLRTIYESLAMKYREALDRLSSLSGRQIPKLHIIGGGTRNMLLCQMTADATSLPVVAGPVEATAIGNACVQMISLGWIDNIAAARTIVGQSFSMTEYAPQKVEQWDEAYSRFQKITHVSQA
jgi:rhamnulokinase